MDFGILAVIMLASLAGPLLAFPARWHLPVVLGELLAGIALGHTGIQVLDASNETFTFMSDLGFALIMFVAGTHVPVRDARMRPALAKGAVRAAVVGVVATGLAAGVSAVTGQSHVALYAVLMASSSAALVLPIVGSLGLGGPRVIDLLPQIAIADSACILALPLVIDPAHAGRAALGALEVLALAALLYSFLRWFEASGRRKRLHRMSEDRAFALELRSSLIILFSIAAVAVNSHVSIMLAGFAFGVVTSAIGEPRRLAHQLFSITEGFLGPVFFVWLGASLNLRDLVTHPSAITLGLLLGLGATLAHAAPIGLGQPPALSLLAVAQLGVPVAAATIGTQLDLLAPGEAAALILGALIAIGVAVLGGSLAARAGLTDLEASSTGSEGNAYA